MNLFELFKSTVTLIVPVIALFFSAVSIVFQILEYRKNSSVKNYSITNIYLYTLQVDQNYKPSNYLSSFLSRFIDPVIIAVYLIFVFFFQRYDLDLFHNFDLTKAVQFFYPFYIASQKFVVFINILSIILSFVLLLIVVFGNKSPTLRLGTIFYFVFLLIGLFITLYSWQTFSIEIYLNPVNPSLSECIYKLIMLFSFTFQLMIFSRLIKLSLPPRFNVLNYEHPAKTLFWNIFYLLVPFHLSIALFFNSQN